MANKIGNLIKKARTEKGLSQAELADKAGNVTASEIGKAERGEKELSDAQLKAMAKPLGVTQKSLLEAAASSKYTSGAKTSAAKTTKKETSSSSAKTTSVKLTSAEKTIIELYRAADSDTKKKVKALLKGEEEDGLSSLLTALSGNQKQSKKEDDISSLITSLTGGKESSGKNNKDSGLLGNILQSAAKDLLK